MVRASNAWLSSCMTKVPPLCIPLKAVHWAAACMRGAAENHTLAPWAGMAARSSRVAPSRPAMAET